MRYINWAFFAVLVVYSGVLLVVEANTSQDFVRHYFSDIEGPRPFFAVNTTLSTFLLTGAAMLLVFVVFSGKDDISSHAKWFFSSQALILSFLAFDDRFQLHEALAYRIGIADHFVMASWAVAEVGLVIAFAKLADITVRAAILVALGGVFFAVMMVFDAVVAHDMTMRLSIEDLAKSWAAALFFAASWHLARFHLGLEVHARSLATWLAEYRNRSINKPLNVKR